ncbi:DUF6207 family protein [Streptomyces subrutilus]|uniref:Uncharacterized protein n=1 Tax=Streptomyces subrutilus TaxID=36818 RepID=A0A5P2USS2_9ACTN|nr:DUF6207 family protein [Streptomyces subrutilus]QEU82382.1 hypothetical protein CP968_32665 [Streptomyces subrutilus]WSJ28154.1 DUF6207 family protein [Streptomyces subrutilus]GGZ70514.1 hypothetical protein GCM10010371_33060 [Streptomyces subrutilus]
MTTIDTFLARSLLLKNPQIPPDVVAYDDTARPAPTWQDALPGATRGHGTADHTAASHLRSLCDVVVARSTPEQITDFITEQLPAPHGAWILGCLLHLADAEDGARFWWQYAAGAGVAAASYCLALHHRAGGDRHAAAFWHDQADADRSGIGTCLRILDRLAAGGRSRRTEAAIAVMSYIAEAVTDGYLRYPEYEIPLPGPYFAECIQIILNVKTTGHRTAHPAEPAIGLPARPPSDAGAPAATGSGRPCGEGAERPNRVLVELAATDEEAALAFPEAVAACWQSVTVDRATANRGEEQSEGRWLYYLDRVPAA